MKWKLYFFASLLSFGFVITYFFLHAVGYEPLPPYEYLIGYDQTKVSLEEKAQVPNAWAKVAKEKATEEVRKVVKEAKGAIVEIVWLNTKL